MARVPSRPGLMAAMRVAVAGFGVAAATFIVAFGGSSDAAGQPWQPDEEPAFGLFANGRMVAPPSASDSFSPGVKPLNDRTTGRPQSQSTAPVSLAAAASDAVVTVGTGPAGVAATNTRAYVANSGSNSVSVIDLTAVPPTVVATIPVGAFPVGVAVSSDGSQAYVANYNANSLSIISTATNTVTNTVAVGSRPNGVIRVASSVYVANLTGNSVSVVNPSTGAVTNTVSLGGTIAPAGLAANAGGTRLYASDARNGKLVVLDLTLTPPTVLSSSTTVGAFPAYVSVAGTTGYVANPGSNSVSVVNLAVSPPTLTTNVAVGTANYGVVAHPNLGQVLVTNSSSNNGSVIDTATNTAPATFTTGTKPNAIVLTPDGNTAVFSNQGDNTLSVVHVNQRPVNTVPGAQTVNANGTGSANKLTFSAANSNALSTSDDAAPNPVTVTVSSSHGNLSLATLSGLTGVSGNNTHTVSFSGTVSDVVAALAGMTYTPDTGYVGSDTLTLTVADQGNTGIGLTQSDTDTVAITVQNVAPVVGNVSFTGAVGNTIFGVGTTPAQPSTTTAGTVLSNSTDANNDAITAGPANITSTNGATVSMSANGTFTYVSAPGYTGSDTFTFTVSDGKGGSTNGTATVAVANRVWYANNALGVNGNGTSVSPFNTLANLRGAGDSDSPGDFIFLFTGSGNYTGGLPLESSQQLIGQPQSLVVGAQTLWTGAGTNPTITNAGGAGIDLANDNVIRRVNVTNTSLQGISGGAVTNVDIGPNLSITNSTGAGFSLSGAATGTVIMAGSITHSSGSARSVLIQNRTGGTVTLSGAINDTGGGVFLNSNTGTTMTFTGGITSTSFTAQGGGTVNVTGTNTLSTTTGAPLTVTGTAIGASGLTFQSISANGATSGIVLNGTGSAGGLTVTGLGGAADSGGVLQSLSGDGISLTNVGAAVSLNFMRTTNVTGTDVLVDGGAANVGVLNTPITNQSGKNRSIVVQNRTGGTVTFSGAIDDSGTGINLNSNTGATISLTGGLVMSTGANAAFSASGGGTVNVTGSANTITTTTGTALSVQNTTIGASNLNFRSISAGTAASGPANGIVLVNTGAGRLIVSGTGSAGTGGTIQRGTGADGATAGIGIRLDTTNNPSFSWMTLQNFDNFAIQGNAVTGLTLANSTITGTNGNNAGIDEASVAFTNLTGSVSINNTSIQGAIEDNFRVVNSSGTLNRLTFDTVTIGPNSVANGNDGIGLEATGGTFNVTVQNSTFTSAAGDLFQLNVLGTAASDLIFQNNQLSNNHSNIAGGGGGTVVAVGSSGDLTYDINNNTFKGSKGSAVVVNKAFGGAPGDGTASGRIRFNTIGQTGVANSGSSEASGIFVGELARGTHTTFIQNNTIRRYTGDGILVQAGGAAQSVTGVSHDGTLNVTIQGNTIAEPNAPGGGLAQNGIRLNAGTNSTGGNDNYNVCMAIGDPSDPSKRNTLTGSEALGGSTYRLQKRFDADVFLPGYTGAATDGGGLLNTNLTTYLTPRTTGAISVNATASGSGGFTNTAGSAPCPLPA